MIQPVVSLPLHVKTPPMTSRFAQSGLARASAGQLTRVLTALVGLAVLVTASEAGARARRVAQAAPVQVPAATQANLPLAIDLDIKGDAQRTVLSFTAARLIDASAAVLEKPDRVVIDLPEVNFQFGNEAAPKAIGLTSSYRYGLFGTGRSRMVMDLAHPALAELVISPPRSDGTVRVAITLTRTDRERF
ncbi:MAG: AMIN domain-containing protein, partial [Beijerinckiaceae bacterium]